MIGTLTEYKATYKNGTLTGAQNVADAQITFFLTAVDAWVVRYCGVAFTNSGNTQQTFTDYLDGNDSGVVLVKNPPIVAVTSVTLLYEDGSTSLLDSTSYRYDTDAVGAISLVSSSDAIFANELATSFPGASVYPIPCFPRGVRNVKVIYTGGYTSAPADLRMAVYQTVDEMLAKVGVRGTEEADSISDFMKTVKFRFEPYKRIVC